MSTLKLKIFEFIDEVIDYKRDLRFEIDEAKREIDHVIFSTFSDNERFINYSSRIKEDESLKEKIIRQNYQKYYKTPSEIFDTISDIIGCRIECRFMNDEYYIFQELFRHFPNRMSDGYYKSDINPKIELNLDEKQPLMQKNGFSSYRVDGRYLGKRVFNFELQIKSIVNVFWNEIDHKILYKNYNYVVTGDFVREMMGSIKGDLTIIDKQLEMVYNHLRSLDSAEKHDAQNQIKAVIGRTLQDMYITPLREVDGLVFDFRSSIDVITSFLFDWVKYESRESLAGEFVRIMDEAMKSNFHSLGFGETINFVPPIVYNGDNLDRLGKQVEEEMNAGIIWNLIVCILFDLNPDDDPRMIYQNFVDYLYFRVFKMARDAFVRYDMDYQNYEEDVQEIVTITIDYFVSDLKPDYFTDRNILRLKKQLIGILKDCKDDKEKMKTVTARYQAVLSESLTQEEKLEEEMLDAR